LLSVALKERGKKAKRKIKQQLVMNLKLSTWKSTSTCKQNS